MGYSTRVSGEIAIVPPLTAIELRKIPPRDNTSVHVEIEQESVETDEGILTRMTSSTVVPTYPHQEVRAYYLIEELQAIVSACPGHEWLGHLFSDGGDAGDLWRAQVEAGKVVKVKARIVWPDGTEGAS